jgi:GntR family transcriptional regulator
MLIQITPSDGVPIYRQIMNQVKYAIASGKIQTGEELPPIRVLAERLSVNPNTIAKAYNDLESEGVVVKRHGAGTFVADQQSPLARREQRKILVERIDQILAEASQLDFSIDEVVETLKKRHAMLVKTQSVSIAKGKSHAG